MGCKGGFLKNGKGFSSRNGFLKSGWGGGNGFSKLGIGGGNGFLKIGIGGGSGFLIIGIGGSGFLKIGIFGGNGFLKKGIGFLNFPSSRSSAVLNSSMWCFPSVVTPSSAHTNAQDDQLRVIQNYKMEKWEWYHIKRCLLLLIVWNIHWCHICIWLLF